MDDSHRCWVEHGPNSASLHVGVARQKSTEGMGHAMGLRPLALTLAALVATVSLLAAGVALTKTGAAHASPRAHSRPGSDAVTGQFSRHVLNALLVPLLDDDAPPRWTDVALRHFCGPATWVEVDGEPLVPGSPIPADAFTVRWHIDRCWPLDYSAFQLSGRVDLSVYHEDMGLSAVIQARDLRISSAKGSGQLMAAFAASMSLDSVGPRREQ